MTIELPVLRLGLAGFSADQQYAVHRVLRAGAGETTSWQLADLDVADALWVNGARTQLVGDERIRVASGVPREKAHQINMADVDRPIAFAQPLPAGFEALCSFDLASSGSMAAVLNQFEAWLKPLIAQFCLASHIVEHESTLGAGKFELRLNSELLAVVDMHGEAAVRTTASPEDFDGGMWRPSARESVPDDFARTSLSRLMWQYGTRTLRDVLPRRYRAGLLYFRRAPHLPQRMVDDSHLLVIRELMIAPATFTELQQRCGFDAKRMAQLLGALYLVGSITSNPKRAAPSSPRANDSETTGAPSHLPSGGLDSVVPSEMPAARQPVRPDLTVPAPLRPDH
jgi:hypothetical protein